MDKKILDKILELQKKAERKRKFVVVDSQKDKRFSNEHVYNNNVNIYNKD